MAATGATRVVLCDDDAVLRSVIGRVAENQGFSVSGESDTAMMAMELIKDNDADVVVLDLALRTGNGEDVIRALKEQRPSTCIIVFSSYVDDPMRLIDAGANVVVEKPDFRRLEEVMGQIQAGLRTGNDTRRPLPRLLPEVPPPAALSVSGLEPWSSFRAAVDHLAPGDSIMAFDVVPPSTQRTVWDDVFYSDYRLAAARALATARRDQDRVSISPEGIPVMLVMCGHVEAPTAVFDRLEAMWAREVATGVVVAAVATIGTGRPRSELLQGAIALVQEDPDPSHPLRLV